jgi:rare lipoprotein A
VPIVIARLLPLAVAAALAVACAGPRAVMRPTPAVVGAEERGLASWYGHPYHGRRTSSGEVYDMHAMTAAHRTLPFSTWLHVENLDTGQTVRVRVNDRGPYVKKFAIDLSRAAARALGVDLAEDRWVDIRIIALPGEEPLPESVLTAAAP